MEGRTGGEAPPSTSNAGGASGVEPAQEIRMPDRRVAVVTGANKGIGLEIARQLARQGTTVFIGARDEGRGLAAAEKLRAEGLDARPLRIDVTDEASVGAAAAEVEKAAGRLDVLVNNAAIAIDDGPPSRISSEVLSCGAPARAGS